MSAVIQAQREIMACGPDLVRIMHLVSERVQALTGASAAAVELREGDSMIYRGASGSALAALGLKLSVHASLSGRCVLSGETLSCPDTEEDPRVDRGACRRLGIRSMLVVPLHSQNKVVGVLKVMSPEVRHFGADDIATLEIMAGFIAEAMAHAAAHDTSRRVASLFEGAFQHAAIGMALVGVDGRFLRVNDALCEIVGYEREAFLVRDFQAITHPADLQKDVQLLRRLQRGEIESYALEKRYLHRLGAVVWIHLTVTAVRNEAGVVEHYVAQVQNITPRKVAESEAHAFFDLSPDLLAIAGRAGQLEAVNSAWERALGFTKEELTSVPITSFIHPDDLALTREQSLGVAQGGAVHNFRHRFRTHEGRYRWLEWNTRALVDGRHYCIARDVTAQVEHEAELQQLASIDALTGLPNRRALSLALDRALAEERKRGGSLACVMLDIDHFKSINDEHGHAAGDEVLRRFARVLRSCLRDGDLSGRWGGEEFAVVLRGKGSADFVSVAERIRRACAETQMVAADPTWRVTVSIGLAESGAGGAHPDDLMRRADEALYEAKNSGRNRVCLRHMPERAPSTAAE